MSSTSSRRDVLIELQLCYRSTMEDGRPALGKLKEGVWVATGSYTLLDILIRHDADLWC
jgi:hypothetical protein